MEFWTNLVVGVLSSAAWGGITVLVGGAAYVVGNIAGRREERQLFVRTRGAKAITFCDELEWTIRASSSQSQIDPVGAGKRLVVHRDRLRENLSAVGDALNGQIDAIKEMLTTLETQPDRFREASVQMEIGRALRSIEAGWPERKAQVGRRMDQVLVDFGIERFDPTRRP